MKQLNAPQPLSTLITMTLLALPVGCDPVGDVGDPELMDIAELEDEAAFDAEDLEPEEVSVVLAELPLPPPPDYDADLDLALDRGPVADSWWGAWVSEETPPTSCDAGMLVTGVDCDGAYCDEVQLRCQSKTTNDSARTWTDWFSEEGGPSGSTKYCANGWYVSGIACDGYWCDRVSLECTNIGISHNCYWTGWFGSNDPWFQTNDGDVVAGVQCGGPYCDQMRFYRCEL